MNEWRCPECGSDRINFMVNLIVKAPIRFYHDLSKRNLRSKDVEVWGASWPTSDIICADCGWWLAHRPRHQNQFLVSACAEIASNALLYPRAGRIAIRALLDIGWFASDPEPDDELAPFGWLPR